MTSRTNALRVLFLFAAFLAYARPSLASGASWDVECNSYCDATVMINDCFFRDLAGGSPATSVCGSFDCFYESCDGSTEYANPMADSWCAGAAAAVGQPYNYWMPSIYGCDPGSGAASGYFYCSYEDYVNCP